MPMPSCLQDIYKHNLWKQNKIKTEAMLQAEKSVLPDYSAFYKSSMRRGSAASKDAKQ